MKCLNCGNDIVLEESKYCNACGAKLPIKKVQCSKIANMFNISKSTVYRIINGKIHSDITNIQPHT